MQVYNVGVFIVIIVTICSLHLMTAYTCPSRCYCRNFTIYGEDGILVECNNIGLTSVPVLPNDTVNAFLRTHRISMLQNGSFDNLNLLRILILSNGTISNIESGAFSNLSNLQQLLLNDNNITEIQKGTFDNLVELQFLYLHDNQITTLQPGLFDKLQKLGVINISNNKITQIHPGTFTNVRRLYALYFKNNNITTVPPNEFKDIPLVFIHLDVFCECDIHPFWTWIETLIIFELNIRCFNLDYKYLDTVEEADFQTCIVYCCKRSMCKKRLYYRCIG